MLELATGLFALMVFRVLMGPCHKLVDSDPAFHSDSINVFGQIDAADTEEKQQAAEFAISSFHEKYWFNNVQGIVQDMYDRLQQKRNPQTLIKRLRYSL